MRPRPVPTSNLRAIRFQWAASLAGLLALVLLAPLALPAGCSSAGKHLQLPPCVEERNYVTVQDVKINYIERGHGDRNVLLVHGFGSSIYSWNDLLGPLGERFHVYAMDVKGFGYSEKPKDADYSLVALMDFVIDFMDAVGLERATLVGHSMGGALCLAAAIDFPERVERLVLIDAAGYPMDLPLPIRVSRMRLTSTVGRLFYGEWAVRWGLKQAFHDPSRVTPERVRAYYLPSRTKNGIGAPLKILRNYDPILFQYAERRIPRVRCPTLVLWGEQDTWVPVDHARRFAEDIPDAVVRLIPDCGHVPQEERPEAVLPLLLAFLGAEGDATPRPPRVAAGETP